MAGYWNNLPATADAVTPDGWFRAGDARYLDAEGYVVHDQVKDMIVSGGENVYPAEVENVLMKHPLVDDVAVIGVPDERWGEAVKVIVVLAPGSPAAAGAIEADLIAFARESLAGYKLPNWSTSPTCSPATRRGSCSSASPTDRASTAASADWQRRATARPAAWLVEPAARLGDSRSRPVPGGRSSPRPAAAGPLDGAARAP
jgi:non-ribosomal peptide synthetase component E (peptide arylation enzyme)